jgi:hypothetical protein
MKRSLANSCQKTARETFSHEHRDASCEVGNDSADQDRLAGTIRLMFLSNRDGVRLLAMR